MLSKLNPLSRYNYHEIISTKKDVGTIKINTGNEKLNYEIIDLIGKAKENHTIKRSSLKELIKSSSDDKVLDSGQTISILIDFGDSKLALDIYQALARNLTKANDALKVINSDLEDELKTRSESEDGLVALRSEDLRDMLTLNEDLTEARAYVKHLEGFTNVLNSKLDDNEEYTNHLNSKLENTEAILDYLKMSLEDKETDLDNMKNEIKKKTIYISKLERNNEKLKDYICQIKTV